jgi:hypothetical protein
LSSWSGRLQRHDVMAVFADMGASLLLCSTDCAC